ncbi:YhgE/Pip domain-containing protein [Virgibacillus senegalensis]|uniref:YhgE/Pip domain-containing protein n=1 Tax=Virgibacillus senegalensis TaxID=1499679 RepID=UPI001F277781|nr:YhgE/Pip domain-containing protein [Virgibacillus senegalensis]
MVKAEWKNLFQSKKLLIVVFGLLMIPILYAGVFLDAMWDPYGSIENLPVAVANEDVAADFEGEKLQLGKELVDRLKDDNNLEWHFTDRTTAMDGLENGDYYMVLVIPENFSQHASTVLDDEPREMSLEYYTNSGQNFIAEKISASAAEDINKEIAQSVTKEYANAMFGKLNDIGDGMAEGADGANEMKDGSQDLGDNLDKLSQSIVTFENGLDSAGDGAAEIAINVGQAAKGATELASGVEAYTAGVRSLNGGIGDYTAGVGTLNNGLQQYTAGVSTLNQGLQQYTSGVDELESGLERQAQGANELASRSSELINGSEQLAEGMEELIPGISQLNDGVQSAASKSGELDEGLNELASGSAALQGQVDKLAEQLQGASANSEQLVQGLNEITAGLKEMQTRMDEAGSSQSGDGLSEQVNGLKAKHDAEIIDTIKNSENLEENNKQALIEEIQTTQAGQSMQPIVDGVNAQVEELNSQMEELSGAIGKMIVQLEGNQSNPGAMEGVSQLAAGYQELEEAVVGDAESKTLQGGVTRLNSGLQDASEGSGALSEGLHEMAAKTGELVKGSSELQNGAEQLNNGVESYTAGVNQLNKGAESLESGAGQLTARSADLESGAQQLDEQGDGLASGSEELDRQSDSLTEGSQALADSSEELTNGANSLAKGLPQLRSGLESLNGGLADLYSGSQELESGASQLEDGSFELAGGADELAEKLREGADEIKDTNTDDGNAEMFSSPTNLLNDEVASVPNYGYGLAPYMMSVALFVGAVIFCLLFPIFQPHTAPTSGFAWWISKYSIVLLVSILQAGIMTAVMVWGLGLEARSVSELFLISIMVSFAFMALIGFFSLAFGNVGRFLMLILLTLQLGGSAGTFPIQLSNGFFKAIHPYLPMTYSIDAYRHAISLGGSITGDMVVLLSIFIVSQIGLLVFFTVKAKKFGNKTETEAVVQ